ncbi:MAG: alpha/beta hydrolase [Propionibacteriaceae bacterium]|jgi:pimeloyl-ACP methyl ester carboxylesterase|nr:alpha/beta hydrolase [Propionibacteriaceae bacterium]
MRLIRTAACLMAAAFLATAALAGCSPARSARSGPAEPQAASSASTAGAVWGQELDWSACDVVPGAECATARAPLDWDEPDGETIELALARVKAVGPGERLGSLLFNPGGPGAGGKSYLQVALDQVGDGVLERYDIVGFDPRGVGESTPITCYETTAEQDAFNAATSPGTPEGQEASLAVAESFAEACEQNTGPLLGHVDTVSAAKDMDLLRALLGDDKLNFLGNSYGTLLGATYAEQFPQNVGRLVLDAAIDPSMPADRAEVEQAAAFEAALGAYLDHCLGAADCPFQGSKQEALDQIHQLLVDIAAEPMSAGPDEPRELTVTLALNGIMAPLYDDANWPFLNVAFGDALEAGDGAVLMFLSDLLLGRVETGYPSNANEARTAISCLDGRVPADLASAEEQAAALAEASPTLGEWLAYDEATCAAWPYPPVGGPREITAAGAAPIVVVGTTGDPATPYSGAVALAEQLESGVLVTFDGEGHGAYGRSDNACVRQAVERYLLEGEPPAEDLSC